MKNKSQPTRNATNREGLTWIEWKAAAQYGGGTPSPAWVNEWAAGVDPTEMGQA